MDVIVDGYGGLNPFLLKVGRFDTVGKIKEKIEQLQGIPIFNQTICFNNEILPDDFYVRDFGIADGSALLLIPAAQGTNAELNRPLPADDENRYFLDNADLESPPSNFFQCEGLAPHGNPDSNNPNSSLAISRPVILGPPPSMRVVVRYNDQRASVPVSRDEPVSALRWRLRRKGFRLPEPCFFIHNRKVMEEDQSFATNEVRHGDLIEPFRGSIVDSVSGSASPSPMDQS